MRKENERVLVLATKKIFPSKSWQGINRNQLKRVLNLAFTERDFRKRGDVEKDPSFRQIIPYIVFLLGNEIFMMQRLEKHTDQRLKNKYSLGIGGHLRSEDLEKSDSVLDWARRELVEEVKYSGNLDFKLAGVLNDDSNDVGRVHLGIVILAIADSPEISVKDEHKSGVLVTLKEARKHYKEMENWSQIVLDFLDHRKKQV